MLNRSKKTFFTAAGLALAALMTAMTTTTALANLNTGSYLNATAMVDDDPVTGDWDAVLSSDMMPEDQEISISLELGDDGETVTGGFTAEDETADFEGTFNAENNTIEGAISDPEQGQSFEVELTIDGDDMTGSITVDAGDFQLVIDVTATRAE
jgi:hypothetical protein